jgi:cytoskeletal protein RodZ
MLWSTLLMVTGIALVFVGRRVSSRAGYHFDHDRNVHVFVIGDPKAQEAAVPWLAGGLILLFAGLVWFFIAFVVWTVSGDSEATPAVTTAPVRESSPASPHSGIRVDQEERTDTGEAEQIDNSTTAEGASLVAHGAPLADAAPPAALPHENDSAHEDSRLPDFSKPSFPTRFWTDVTGKYQVEAKLIEVRDSGARLLKANGEEAVVPLEKLSESDRRYIQSQVQTLP